MASRIEIESCVKKCTAFFAQHKTLSYEFRRTQLEKLHTTIRKYEDEMFEALYADLHKSRSESFMSEISLIYDELHRAKKELKKWMKATRVPTPLALWRGKSEIHYEAFGTVLIMSPWNYPLNLSLIPLVGALAAGNCVILKPSNAAPHCSALLQKIIGEAFPADYVSVISGGREENTALLEQRFDYIFFTGGETVARLVMQSAARNLTPLTLELGGKSPCIIAPDANLDIAARRILFGKLMNAGQTCVAPDYLLIPQEKKTAFVEAARKVLSEFFPTQDYRNEYFPHIINEKHFDRLCGLMTNEHIALGGTTRRDTLFIEATILDDISFDSRIMQEEIFGPLLPMISYNDIDEVFTMISERPKPLALYLFSQDKALEKRVLSELSFGGACINDTIVHLANSNLPFGGVGLSGMGKYHGFESFACFSNKKSVYKKHGTIDIPVRYHPYSEKKLSLLQRLYARARGKKH